MRGKPFEKNDLRINRNGRPKKDQTMTDILNQIGDIKDETVGKEIVSKKIALAFKIWDKAIKKSDMAAIKYIYDRIDGMPRQTMGLEHSGDMSFFERIYQAKKEKDKKKIK